ncbi:TonB-dependent receptor [Sediminitomix flava]|uniref:Outer membrane receptor protein involved in Fe transport n=1 Tax=Sediminitomix flava TaxID=379075 RepID=A0A315ZT93_SEDFL|nr:TonB-dependent receptor [Sediminitomix flava]PWJ38444.1 outer membrane receptor protein involved in Fe transport [Sediminitomix flava]
MKQKFFILLSLLLFKLTTNFAQGEKFTISGFVKEKSSGERLPGVSIYLLGTSTGVSTNAYGFYSITLPKGEYDITYSFVGYGSQTIKINLSENVDKNMTLVPSYIELQEIEVNAQKINKVSDEVQMSVINIPTSQIQEIPVFLGEKDIIKVIQLMPGVQSGREGSAGLFVRGGSDDQNLLILDDANVYNAQHLFGFFSVFNGDAIKSVDLYKGGFPARFGGRLSSVLDMQMKDGHQEEFHGKIGLGLISSNLTLEGPIQKGKSSFLLSGRRTYFDVVSRPLMTDEFNSGYYFYDINAKVNFELGKKDRIFLSGFSGRDNYYLNETVDQNQHNENLYWGNLTGTLRWNHIFSNKLFSNLALITSNYNFNVNSKDKNEDDEVKTYNLNYKSLIDDYTIKFNLDYLPNPKHAIKLGVTSTFYKFAPAAFVYASSLDDNIPVNTTQNTYTQESAIYIEDDFKLSKKLHFNLGIRYSLFRHDDTYYDYFEPRLSSSLKLNKSTALKASFATMNQYVHKLSNTGVGLPTDLWVTSTKNVIPQTSNQIALGFAKDLPNDINFTLEGYYKWSENVIQYKEGANFLMVDFEDVTDLKVIDWQNNITRGDAKSYGFEVLLQKKYGRFSGWAAYTLAWAKLKFDELNNGKEFWASWDRRHDLSLVGIYKLRQNITLSGVWVFGSGTPYTIPTDVHSSYRTDFIPNKTSIGKDFNVEEVFIFPGGDNYYYDERNNFRSLAFHRLDFSIQFHKAKRRNRKRTWEVSLFNVYGRQNPFYYRLNSEVIYNPQNRSQSTSRNIVQVSLFRWIPSFSYKLEF